MTEKWTTPCRLKYPIADYLISLINRVDKRKKEIDSFLHAPPCLMTDK